MKRVCPICNIPRTYTSSHPNCIQCRTRVKNQAAVAKQRKWGMVVGETVARNVINSLNAAQSRIVTNMNGDS